MPVQEIGYSRTQFVPTYSSGGIDERLRHHLIAGAGILMITSDFYVNIPVQTDVRRRYPKQGRDNTSVAANNSKQMRPLGLSLHHH